MALPRGRREVASSTAIANGARGEGSALPGGGGQPLWGCCCEKPQERQAFHTVEAVLSVVNFTSFLQGMLQNYQQRANWKQCLEYNSEYHPYLV